MTAQRIKTIVSSEWLNTHMIKPKNNLSINNLTSILVIQDKLAFSITKSRPNIKLSMRVSYVF